MGVCPIEMLGSPLCKETVLAIMKKFENAASKETPSLARRLFSGKETARHSARWKIFIANKRAVRILLECILVSTSFKCKLVLSIK